MNRTLRKRKQPNQAILNTRSSAAAAASAAATAIESPSISPVSKRIKIEKEEEPLETTPAVVVKSTEAVEKSVNNNSSPAEAKELTTAASQKIKTPEPSSDVKTTTKEVQEPPAAKPTEAKAKEVEVIEKKQSPPEKKEVIEVEEEEEVPAVDPYESLSEADRKLFFTDIVGFLKRFTPKYHVPVYRTWSISKSASK